MRWIALLVALWWLGSAAAAEPLYKVGLARREVVPTGPYDWRQDPKHSLATRIWYPAEPSAREKPWLLGPPDRPFLDGGGRVLGFGQGLGEAATDPTTLWREIVTQFGAASPARRSPAVLLGFISGLHQHDPACATVLLDEAVNDDVLGPVLPILQTGVPIDADGIARLNRAIASGRTPTAAYRNLCWRAGAG